MNITKELKEEIFGKFIILANHPTASHFIKKFITNFKSDEEAKDRITNIIKENFNNIVQNQNGNIIFFTILNVTNNNTGLEK